MKHVAVIAPLCALVLLTACRPSPEKLLATANKYHDNKKYKEAAILYQKVISQDKKNGEAYYRAGLNLLDEGNAAEAVGYLRRAVDLQPKNVDAAAKLADIYLTAYLTNPPKLKAVLAQVQDLQNKINQAQPDAFQAIRLAGILDILNGKTDEAIQQFDKANKVHPYSRDLIGWYAEALTKEHPDQAQALVQDMLAHDKTWGPGYDYLFLSYRKAGQASKAEGVLRERYQNNPKSAVALINLANFLLVTNRFPEGESVMKQALDDKAAFPNGRQMVGDFYARARKYDQALDQFKQGAAETPKQALLYNQRIVELYVAEAGQLAAEGKRDEASAKRGEARKLAQSLAAKNPKDAASSEMYAALLLQPGSTETSAADVKQALPEMVNLVKNVPNDPVLHVDLARAYLATQDVNKALNEASEAVQEETKSRTPRPAILLPSRLLTARIYELRGQHAQALDESEQALKLQDANPEARLLRSEALIGLHELDQAQPDLEKLVQQYPTLNEARLSLANLYVQQRNFAKADEQFQKVWTANPPDVRGYIGLQQIKLAEGKPEEAVKGMQDLIAKNSDNAQFRYQLANAQAIAGAKNQASDPSKSKAFFQSAADNYNLVLKTNPKSAETWVRLSQLQRQLGQNGAALSSLEHATDADPQSVDALMSRAMLLDAMGRKKEAGDFYNRVLGIDPNNALALNNLAFMNADTGTNLDQAMTFAERAKKQAPKSPDVADTLGYVYYRKNLNAAALEIFKQNVQDQPQNPTFHLHLAMALLKQGDKQGARDEAAKALKIAPPSQHQQIESFVNQIG